MRTNPFLSFHRAAERDGYPALLVVSVVCLALVVAPVGLLSLTGAGWALGLALLSVLVAVALLSGAIAAALSESGEPATSPADKGDEADDATDAVTVLPRREPPVQSRKVA